MATTLATKVHNSLIILKQTALVDDSCIPTGLRFRKALELKDLLVTLIRERAGVDRALIVLGESDFIPCINFLRDQLRLEDKFPLAVLVVSKTPNDFLEERSAFPELLDAVSVEEFKKETRTELYRCIRQMIRAEELAIPRLGQQTLLKLNDIFIALSAERDPKELLNTILVKGIELTSAESGSLFMIEEDDGELYFRAKIGSHLTDPPHFQPTSERVSEGSLCGYVALTGKSINIKDVPNLRPYNLPLYNPELDHAEGQVQTLLTVPLQNRRKEIIAILQLCNKRFQEEGPDVQPRVFGEEDEGLLSSFGTQAAICLENVDLYGDIQRLFDGFVKASITAIESRDPSTGGHSERVARMTVALAQATTECQTGVYRSVKFKDEEIVELNYAALLHDFGKIGVREEVLVKAKKLYPYQLEAIQERIRLCQAAARIQMLEKDSSAGKPLTDREYQNRLIELEGYWNIINKANEPSVLNKEWREALDKIRSEKLLLPGGKFVSVLTDEEYTALSVSLGSLTEGERLEVESHVRHTYQFLKMIPWTRDFKNLTEIAYAHHEKLDGSGYPRNLTSHEIPLQSKIMTISDIFDALTAADRWYKEAVPMHKALEILGDEVARGKLDPVLYEIFVEKKIYELNTQTATKIVA